MNFSPDWSLLPSLPPLSLPPSFPPVSYQELVLDALLAGKAATITAIYYLMLNRLARYERVTPKAQRVTVSRMKKSKSYAGQSPTEEDLVAAHVDAGKAPVQRVSHQPYGRVIHMSVIHLQERRASMQRGPVVYL